MIHKFSIFFPQKDPLDIFKHFQDYAGVVLDGHEYQCFGSFWNELAAQPGGWETHLTSACAYGAIGQKLLLVLYQLSEK